MKALLTAICLFILFMGCQSSKDSENIKLKNGERIPQLNIELSKAIDKMANRHKQMKVNTLQFLNRPEEEQEELQKLKLQVDKKHAESIQDILKEHGYPTESLVGKKSSDNFFMLLENTRDFPLIKKQGIEAIKSIPYPLRADSLNYISLVDQYAFENNLASQFGTVVNFNQKGQAYIANPGLDMDSLRMAYGLDSLKFFLNERTIKYFEFNREELSSKGITSPLLY